MLCDESVVEYGPCGSTDVTENRGEIQGTRLAIDHDEIESRQSGDLRRGWIRQ